VTKAVISTPAAIIGRIAIVRPDCRVMPASFVQSDGRRYADGGVLVLEEPSQKAPKSLLTPARRAMNRQEQGTYEFGAFHLDVAEHRLLRHGQPVPLTPKIFELLRVLVENAGHLVEKDRLLTELWPETFVEEANLNRGISVLRKALGEAPADRYIETVPRRGYRFVAAVRVGDSNATVNDQAASTPAGLNDQSKKPPGIRPALSLRVIGIALGLLLTISAIIYAVVGPRESNITTAARGASIHRQLTFTGKELTPALSPDGRRIAYVSNAPPLRKVIVRELAAGQPVEVFSAPETGGLRWSPDSLELMFSARGAGTDGLYIAPHSGGSARKVAGGNMFVACWSPDGSMIALALFVSSKLLFLNRVGEVQRTIALRGTRDWIWDLDWSPVSGRLLFVADDDQRRPSIWTIRPDGTDQTRLFTATAEILGARWARGGDAFYYFVRVNQTVSLYKADVDQVRRTADATVPLLSGLETDQGFGLSADGARLVYARSPYYSNLYLVEAVGSERGRRIRQTQLTHGTSVVERPRVSPDGKSILFSMGYESRADLYTMPATGGTPRQLTFLNAFSIGGVWSRDGRSVAFASNEGGRTRLWLVNADGSSPRPLPSGEMSDSFEMSWSPGGRLLYQQAGNRNYYLVDSEIGQQRLLIKDSSVGWVGSPVYSPDGNTIAVSWNRRPDPGLWLISSDGSRETLIHGPPRPSESMPLPIGWSPDAAAIYSVDGKTASYRGLLVPFELTTTEARILRVPVNGGPPTTVMSLPFEEIGTVTMFPDGQRFLCSVYSSRSDIWVVEDFDAAPESRTAQRSR
jgi:Tol biopolymer transport system component/DNA-binding winged helix-turn-helix (wHTH) protein